MSLLRLLLALACIGGAPSVLAARFTWHGELLDGDAAAQGRYDLQVRAYATSNGATPLDGAFELPGVAVKDGRFAVELELPEDTDGVTWFEVALRASDSGEPYVVLGERQPVAKANSTCPGAWALDGNTGLPANSFLGIADPASDGALELRVANQRVARFAPNLAFFGGSAPQVVLGSSNNVASGGGATVAGGGNFGNGQGNVAAGSWATIGGGFANVANGSNATIAGGSGHIASGQGANVAGGASNDATGDTSSVGGGSSNIAAGNHASVPGGTGNLAGGNASFAGGFNARVRQAGQPPFSIPAPLEAADYTGVAQGDFGSFAWSGIASSGVFRSTGPNQFLIRADGGVMFNTNALPATTDDVVIGARPESGDADADLVWRTRAGKTGKIYLQEGDGGFHWFAGNLDPAAVDFLRFSNNAHLTRGGVFTNASSRALKHRFAAIDAGDILARVLRLPISTWSYKGSAEGAHLGPVAEDFQQAFGLGDGGSIATVDADGVALAAIQGLNAKLEAENRTLRRDLDALAKRLERLEAQQSP